MIGQKDAVVIQVKTALGSCFTPYKDIALVMLSKLQLENIKSEIGHQIMSGSIEYSKNKTNYAEVKAYARSMVMNHLKKARELNGNQVYGVSTSEVKVRSDAKALSGINMSLLPEDVKEFVKSLV
jgi:hypothetical protein